MFRMFKSWFSSGRKRAAGSVPSCKPKRRTCLSVEALEDRLNLSPTAYFEMLIPTNVVVAGGSVSLTVQERNYTTGQLITSGGVSSAALSFVSNGISSPLETIPLSGGIGQTTLTLTKAETGYFDATNGAITGNTSGFLTTVEPGPVTHFAVSAAASQETAGTPFKVTVTAEDQYGNTVPTANLNPSLGASYGFPVLVSSSSWSQGVSTYTVTLDVAGSTSLTASRLAGTPAQIVTGTTSITINPGPATHFVVSTASTETAGDSFKVSITAEDAENNVVTSYNQTPTITASYGHPVSVSSNSWSKGVATATVTLDTAGSTTLTATAGSVKGTSGSITVNPGPATHFVVSTGSTETVGDSFKVTITAEDANNNVVTSYNQTPTITASYGHPVSVSSSSWSKGVATATVTLNYLGSTTLTATAGSVKGTSSTITVDAQAQPPGNTWAGYAINPGSGVTAVGGSWTQPAITGSNNAQAAIWVGIDGYGNGTVEQCGTWATMVNGTPQYVAWYEFFGDYNHAAGLNSKGQPNQPGPNYYEVAIPQSQFAVHAGDKISAEVELIAGTTTHFIFLMSDQPAAGGPEENFLQIQIMQYVTPLRATAEWIVENPNGAAQPLANFGKVNFTGAWATVGSTTGSFNSFADPQALSMSASTGSAYASNPPVSANSLGYGEPAAGVSSSSFTVTYGTAGGTGVGISQASADSSAASANAVVDAVFAQDALDSNELLLNHVGTSNYFLNPQPAPRG